MTRLEDHGATASDIQPSTAAHMCDRAAKCIRRLIIIDIVAMIHGQCSHILIDIAAISVTILAGICGVIIGEVTLASCTTTLLDGTAHIYPSTACLEGHSAVQTRQMP